MEGDPPQHLWKDLINKHLVQWIYYECQRTCREKRPDKQVHEKIMCFEDEDHPPPQKKVGHECEEAEREEEEDCATV